MSNFLITLLLLTTSSYLISDIPAEFSSDSTTEEVSSIEMLPINSQRSISHSNYKTNSNNIKAVLNNEFNDISKDLGNRLTGQIEHINDTKFDRDRFKQIFLIKKRIITNGQKRIVNINLKEKIVPREVIKVETINDNGIRALLGCILLLLAGLVFTTSLKMYHGFIKRRCPKLTDLV